jgi:hypothetical protein
MNILDLIADDNFKYNIKRSMIVKNIKKYDLSEFKIKQKDGCFEIYIKKNGSNKKIKKVYEFKTYNKSKKSKRVYENNEEDIFNNVNNNIVPVLKKIKL